MRLNRELFEDAYYYIYTSSYRKGTLFRDEEDFERYLRLIKENKRKFGLYIYGFCFIKDEIHLVLSLEKPENLTLFFNKLHRLYTQHVHKRFKSKGKIWSGKYKVLLIQKQKELFDCVKYLEYLPVHKEISRTPVEYPWSSCIHRVLNEQNSVIDRLFFDNRQTSSPIREIFCPK